MCAPRNNCEASCSSVRGWVGCCVEESTNGRAWKKRLAAQTFVVGRFLYPAFMQATHFISQIEGIAIPQVSDSSTAKNNLKQG